MTTGDQSMQSHKSNLKQGRSAYTAFLGAFLVAGLLSISVFDSAWAKSNGRKRVEAKVETSDYEFKSRREVRLKEKKYRDRFVASLEVPAGSLSATDLQAADVLVTITREGQTIATCDLGLDTDSLVSEDDDVQWKVDVRKDIKSNGRKRLRSKYGSCQPVLPAVKAGDVATVTATVGALSIQDSATYQRK